MPIAYSCGSAPVVEREPADQRLRQVAAHAVAENRDLGADVDARLERRLLLAVLVDAAIAGADADDAIAVVQHFRRGEAGEDVDAFRLDLPAEPLHERLSEMM